MGSGGRDLPRVVALGLLSGVLVGGCGGGGWLKDYPDVAERARLRPGSFVEPARRQWDGLAALGASYSMRVTKGIAARSFDLYISMERADRIDILVLAPTGLIEASLRANERQVGLFVREEKVLYAGAASRNAFARALGFDLSVADAVAVLLGYGAEASRLPPGVAVWDGEARRIRIDHGDKVSVWLHPVTQRFGRVVHRDGRGTVTAEVSEWIDAVLEPVGPATGSGAAGLEVENLDSATTTVSLPALIRMQVEPDGYGLRLRLVGEPDPNPSYPADSFDLQYPPGVLVRPLEDLAREGGLFRRTVPRERDG